MLLPSCVPSFSVGSPWTAYHCRSTIVFGTPAQLAVKWAPPSSDRAVAKLARDRSAKYRWPAESTASSVSPPCVHVGGAPSVGAAAGTHLNVFPASFDRQMKLVPVPRPSGTLV